MKELGLRLNAKKSVLPPVQRTTYLGVVRDLTVMQACRSPARIESILRVREGQSLTDGSYVQCDNFWPAAYETFVVAAQDHRVFPEGQHILQDQGHTKMLTCL